jgi:DNA-binding GntR family transcriptional regulator
MTVLEPLQNNSLRHRVYAALQIAIVTGELAPGARVRDQELATRLGVSRTPVREALQRLEDEGLVQTSPRAATRVTPLDAQAAREAFPVVAALHALATRLGIPHLTPADTAKMREANGQLRALIASPSPAHTLEAMGADDRFHAVLIAAAGNREIVRALDRLMPKVRRLEYAQFGSLAGRRSVHQHEAIISACERGAVSEGAVLVEENWLSLGRLIVASLGAVTVSGDAAHASTDVQDSRDQP